MKLNPSPKKEKKTEQQFQQQRLFMKGKFISSESILNSMECTKTHFGYEPKYLFIIISVSISLLFSTILIHQESFALEYLSPVSSSSNSDQITNIKIPSNKVVEATGKDGTSVSYSVSATDDSGNKVSVNCNPPSGSTFAIGTTEVLCSTDGSSLTKSFSITVRDTTPPTIFVPRTPYSRLQGR
jgi:hypothetical protein